MLVFDDDISGAGQFDFGSSTVAYALWTISTIGPDVRPLEVGSPDHLLRVGWISFGFKGFDAFGVPEWFWDAPIWLDFVKGRWHPTPAVVAGGSAGIYADGVRWQLGTGTVVRLNVGT